MQQRRFNMKKAHNTHTETLRTVTILVAVSFGLLGVVWTYPQLPSDRVDRLKREYKFDTWAGNVKTNISISSLKGLHQELQLKLKREFQVFTPESDTDKHVNFTILADKVMSGADISLGILSSARKAQEAPFNGFVTHSGKPNYTLASSNSEFDIGDMCLYGLATNAPAGIVLIAGRPFIGRLWFSRGNVAVKIINNAEPGKEYLDVLSIAKEIDSLLCKRGRKDYRVTQ
jgi:hypothetical protein